MTTFSWKTGTSADWNTPTDWNQGSVPNAGTADAIIGVGGTYTVTIASGESFLVDSVTLTNPYATLDVNGTLALGGTEHLLAVDAGVFDLGNSGFLNGGTVALAGGTAALGYGATLDAVTWVGRLAVYTNLLYVEGGLTVLPPGGVGPGTIDLLASGANLDFLDTETLNNVVVLAGGNGTSYIYQNTGTQTLTFGPTAQLLQTDGSFQLYGPGATGGTFVNEGIFTLSDGGFYADIYIFTNAGTMTLADGENFTSYGGLLFTNTGTISIGGGAVLTTGSSGTFDNTGSISIAAGGTLNLQGTVGLAELGAITGAGRVELTSSGTLELGTGTLDLGTSTTFTNLLINGLVQGGTIVTGAGTLSFGNSATLDGVTVLGTLAPGDESVAIEGGLTVKTPAGALPGTIDLRGGTYLYFRDNETLDNAVVLTGSPAGTANFQDVVGSGITLTLGSHLQFYQTGYTDQMYFPYSGDAFVNNGTMALAGGTFNDYGTTFNNGTIALSAGENFTVQGAYTFANAGSISIGAGSVFNTGNGGTFSNTGSIFIAAGGTLDLQGTVLPAALGAISGPGEVEIGGTLELGTGTLNVAPATTFAHLLINGLVVGGTILENGGTVAFGNSATLDGVTVLGTLAPGYANVVIEGGLTVKTAAGALPGTIDLRGDTSLYFRDSETLDNAVVLTGSPAGTDYFYDNVGGNITLTLGSHLLFEQTGYTDQLGFYYSGDTLVNDGTMALAGGTFQDYGTTFNNGTIALSAGENFTVQGAYTFANAGSISIGAGSLLHTGSGTFSNTGSIFIAAGGTLDLQGTILPAELGAISGPGTLEIDGLVEGGTLVESGSLTFGTSATLDGVTVLGTLELGNAQVLVEGGLTVETAAGTLPGTVDLRGGSYVSFRDSETLDNAVVLTGSPAGTTYFQDVVGGNVTLTLGSHLQFEQTGYADQVSFYYNGDSLVNDGTMALSGGSFNLYGTTFNNGTIALSAGENFTVQGAYSFVNNGLITVAAATRFQFASSPLYSNTGTIAVGAGGTIQFAATAADFSNTGKLSVAGGGTLEISTNTTLSELGSIVGTGTLVIDAGDTLDLGGGTLDLGTGQSFATLLLNGVIADGTLIYGSGGASIIGGSGSIASTVTVHGTSGIQAQTTISTLDNLAGGTLDIAPGTANSNVLLTGTLADGTLQMAGGLFAVSNGTLDGITVRGLLDLSPYASVTYVEGGLTVQTATGGNPGTIALTGQSSQLIFLDSETLDNVNITFGNTGYYSFLSTQNGAVLTLGSHAVLSNPAGLGYLNGGTIVNDGLINAGGAQFYEYATSFTNAGTITTSNGDTFNVNSGDTFINTGLINIGAGSTFNLSNTGSFSNTGTFNIASGGTLILGGALNLAEYNVLTTSSSGLVDFTGTLNLGGGTLDVKPNTNLGNVEISGTIEDGFIKPDGGTLSYSNATLDDITYLGTLDLSAASTNVYVENGLTVDTATGGTPGAINLTGDNTSLIFETSQTLDNVAITFGSTTGYYSFLDTQSGAVLTLGSHAVLSTGVGIGYFNGGTIVNEGQINAGGAEFYERAASFTNAGTITTSNGDSFNVDEGDTFINTGLINIGAGTTFNLSNPGSFSNTGTFNIAAGGTLILGGTLTLAQYNVLTTSSSGLVDFTGTLNLGGGTLDVKPNTNLGNVEISGTIEDGFIKPDGGTLTYSNATLDDITYLGTLDLSAASTNVYVENGLTVDTATGGTPGAINLTGDNTSLIFQTSQTLDNVAITFGSTTGYYSFLDTQNGAVLTLGSHVVLSTGAGLGYFNGGTIVSDGQINVSAAQFQEYASSFTNAGTLTTSGTDDFTIGYSDTFINTGLINIGAGTTFQLNNPNPSTFSNTGTIDIAAGGTLQIYGSLTVAQLGTIIDAPSAVLNETGTLDLAGGVLDINPATLVGEVLLSNGTLANGTVYENGGSLAFANGYLSDITVLGPLTAGGSGIYVENGLTVETASGGTPGTIDLSVNGSVLELLDSETLNNVVLLGATSGNSSYIYANQGTQTLTLGAHADLLQTGGTEQLYGASAGQAFVNHGTMNLSGGTFADYMNSFSNQGTMTFAAGENFYLASSTFTFINTGSIEALTNSGTVTLNASGGTFAPMSGTTLDTGTWRVDDGTTLDLQVGATITTDAASITLNGPAAALENYLSSNGTYYTIESTLGSIASTGTLALLAGRSWTTALAFQDAGVLRLAGGVFATPKLGVASTGLVIGYGELDENIGAAGTIEASGGTLTITGTIGGTDALVVDANSTMVLEGATAQTVTFLGAGATLQLDAPSTYTGTLTAISPGVTIDLVGESITSAAFNGQTLVVNGASAYAVSGDVSHDRIKIAGSDLIVYGEAQAGALLPASPINLGQVHGGGTLGAGLTVDNTAPATPPYYEKMDASISATGSIVTAGTVSLLAPQATNIGSLTVGLGTVDTASDGVKSGAATVSFATEGTGVDGLPAIPIGSQTVAVSGTVYDLATPALSALTLNLGNTRTTGPVNTGSAAISNGSVADPFQEALRYALAAATTPFSVVTSNGTGTLSAGGTATIGFALGTSVVGGAYADPISVGVTSEPLAGETLAATVLASLTLTLDGTIYNTATASVPALVNLGQTHAGVALGGTVSVGNAALASAYSDALLGSVASTTSPFTVTGALNVAGGASGTLSASVTTSTLGTVSGSTTLDLSSHDAAQPDLSLPNGTVDLTATVYALASPTITGQTLDFVTRTTTGAVGASGTIANGPSSAFQEALAYAVTGTAAPFSVGNGSGTVASGASASPHFSFSDSTGGTVDDTVTVGLTSEPLAGETLAATALVSQAITLDGTAYNTATASVPALVNLGQTHAGVALNGTVGVGNAALASAYSDALLGSVGSTTSPFTVTGALNVAGGATGTLSASVTTATLGTINGSTTLDLSSHDAAQSDLALPNGTVDLTATVYALANPTVTGQTLDFITRTTSGVVGASGTIANGPSSAFQEGLGYAVTGTTAPFSVSNGSGTVASGASASPHFSFSTTTGGTVDDTVTVGLTSEPLACETLAATPLVSQAITLDGTAYNTATASVPALVNLGQTHAGAALGASFSVGNAAPTSPYSDALLGSVASTTSPFTVTGALNVAGGGLGTLNASVTTGTLGAVSGSTTLDLSSHDAAQSDLALPNGTVDLTATVYALAGPTITGQTLDFVARTTTGAVVASGTIANGPPSAFQEALGYAVSGTASPFSVVGGGSGTVASGGSATPQFSFADTTGGTVDDTITVGLTSEPLAGETLAATALASQAITLDGTAYNTATASVPATVNLGQTHAGVALGGTVTVGNLAPSSAYSDALLGSVGSTTSPFAVTGALNVAGGASGTLNASLTTATLGTISGSTTLDLSSHDAAQADLALPNGTVDLTATVFALASPTITGQTLDFVTRTTTGAVAQSATIANGPSSAFQEGLGYAVGPLAAPFSVVGGGSGTVASGGSAAPRFTFADATGGVVQQTVTVGLTSEPLGGETLAATPLVAQAVTLDGTAYATAAPVLSTTTLDFGRVHVGDTDPTLTFGVSNAATGALTDVLTGGLGGITPGAFAGVSGENSLGSGVAAGGSLTLGVSLSTTTAGSYAGTAALSLASHDTAQADLAVSAGPVALAGTVYNYATAVIEANGTVIANGGTANLGHVTVGSGPQTLDIEVFNTAAAGPTDLLEGTFNASGNAVYSNPGFVAGADGYAFSGLVANGAGYQAEIVINTATQGTYTETVTLDATGYETDPYSGALAPITFTVQTAVTCFLVGTRIATPRGEVAVEALREGELVTTLEAGEQVARPIRWIGRRRIDVTAHPSPELVLPIRIRAHAFAEGAPHRDLLVSPDHAVLTDGVLIPARQLVNHASITQHRGLATVEYFHVELDRHAVLLSEGLPTESYLDTGNRALFSNAGLATVLHPEFAVNAALRCWQTDACAPLAVDAARVRPVWQRLAARAAQLGRARQLPISTDDPDLRLRVRGRTLRPVMADTRRAVFAVPPGAREAWLVSRAAAPAALRPWLDDRRCLGVMVGRILIDAEAEVAALPLDHPALDAGWWAAEHDAGRVWRWTNGDARLVLPAGATRLEIQLAGATAYPLAAAPERAARSA
jgi:hypothetical protein